MKTDRKILSDPSSKILVHEQTVDIKRERRAFETVGGSLWPPVPPSITLPQSSTAGPRIDNLL
ncbi:hypothetical protein E1A91_D07G268500v1 [Gossypium mustelinum]|uniref:Uncharacterized protein n=3 Tax=Gossypium TaxID=3633 RepID=A0A5D2UCE4_GOSMU|nr:hypothetical protein ES288_D07G281100v1 [Gossypium darwinii]TYH64615.1 hypothetical protein ES332_D07G279600v1 [Gossypium tomentosum]TYI75342.1 hypothetical protein E1A91_D07G268500v1 [Gossypium mustelinum]